MRINEIFSEFVYKRTYARYLWEENRRERWDETVDRYANYFRPRVPDDLKMAYEKAIEFIREKKISPSMRALWTAGPALDGDNLSGYNCGYLLIDRPKSFAEVLYILMHGAGLGVHVGREYVNRLPKVPSDFGLSDDLIVVEDSKMGWAEGYLKLLNFLYEGRIPNWDLSKIRPAGAPLKTFGGRASGPKPLDKLFRYTVKTFSDVSIREENSRKLTSIECYDLVGMICNTIVVGGVRRSAVLILSDLSDLRMRSAKEGQFWLTHPHRALANISTNYQEKPDINIFIDEWLSMVNGRTGERGIFSSEAVNSIVARSGRRKKIEDVGTNACSEIILRPNQLCNLTCVNVRKDDTLNDLTQKVKYATILGIMQSTLTDFKFVDDDWKRNCEEERLLGVSITGIAEHKVLSNEKKLDRLSDWLTSMKDTSIEVSKKWSKALNINMPTAITALKPAGTSALITNNSSGIHAFHAPFFIRRVRVDKYDPIGKYMIEKGVSHQFEDSTNSYVFEFPIKVPKGSVFRNDKTAIDQLELWKAYQEFYCEHKPSMTVYMKDDEVLSIADWLWKNWNIVSGVSFLPHNSGIYDLAPYEDITEDQYKELVKNFPKDLNFDELKEFDDLTEGAKELSCSSGSCDLK